MHDMGLSNSVGVNAFGDCTNVQKKCYKFPNGVNKNSSHEVSDEVMEKIVFYLSSLYPPRRRNVSDKDVLYGKKILISLFSKIFYTRQTKFISELKLMISDFHVLWF